MTLDSPLVSQQRIQGQVCKDWARAQTTSSLTPSSLSCSQRIEQEEEGEKSREGSEGIERKSRAKERKNRATSVNKMMKVSE